MHQTSSTPWKPSKAQILAARNKVIPDLAAKNLIVLFAGINPGLYTAAVGRHFGRPGNRFWPAIHGGGFTPRLFSPFEGEEARGESAAVNGGPEAIARAAEVAADGGGVEAGVDACEENDEIFCCQIRDDLVARGKDLGFAGFPGSARCLMHRAVNHEDLTRIFRLAASSLML